MQHTHTIKQWAKDDRPREKLIAQGPASLSNAELLAILIHNGTPKKSAVDLAKEVMKLGNDNIHQTGKLSLRELMQVKGIGAAKAVTIAAAMELGRRRQAGHLPEKNSIAHAKDIALFVQERLKDHVHEVFALIYLNNGNKVLGFEIISEGGLTHTVADPRIIVKKALEKNALKIVLCHNHPSGTLQPSEADKTLTEKIKNATALLDITLVDHIIVNESGYFSFANAALM